MRPAVWRRQLHWNETMNQQIRKQPRLQGKVAIVTGGGGYDNESGTGRATAVCLAAEGARVLVADISEENADRTVEQIRADGGDASSFIGDATNSDDNQAMIATAVERYGGLQVLVNNLGFGGTTNRNWVSQKITDIDEQEWQRALDLNLTSAMLASKHAIPAMKDSGGGSIINVSSIDGLAAATHLGAPYSASNCMTAVF